MPGQPVHCRLISSCWGCEGKPEIQRSCFNLIAIISKGRAAHSQQSRNSHCWGGHPTQSHPTWRVYKLHVVLQCSAPGVTHSEVLPAYLGKWLSPPGNLTQGIEQQPMHCGNVASSGCAVSSDHDCTGNSQRGMEWLQELQTLKHTTKGGRA